MIPQETKLLSLLSNNDVTFFIPPYQRNYEWTDEQCQVFLDDVVRTYDYNNDSGKKAEHFFGSITYFQTEPVFGQPNKLVLIDGQQRITTAMLFLVALRDILNESGKEEQGNVIDSRYLKNNNVTGDIEYKIKLKQVETDWVAYKKIILSDELSEREKDSAVFRNYKFFLNKLSDYRDEGADLIAIIEKGLNKFSIITIELQPDKNEWENPQEIFESMNSLGKPLSLADLVRNYLLLGLDSEVQNDLYSRFWLEIEKEIPGQTSNFIRDYMQAHERRSFKKATESNHKELYRLFKRIFEESNSQELLEDLSKAAVVYAYVIRGGHTGDKNIDRELSDFHRLDVTTAYSFFLALLRAWKEEKISSKDTADILKVFKIYCLRRRLLALTMAENKVFPTLANYVPELVEAADKKTKMFDILSKQESNLRLPNDIELTRVLETMNFYNFKHCKFYLSLIEESITRSMPDLGDEKLQIEHIMPQKLNEEWQNELGDDYESIHQDLINTIGNLTLIRHNQELGNKPFSEKKEVYENNAGLQIAKTQITNQDKWDEMAIKSRSEWIRAYLITEVLPIPDERRRKNNFTPKEGRRLSFQELQLIGLDITFVDDSSIRAHVIGDKEVEFEGKKWRLSPLTKEIQERRGRVNASGSYQGAQYWEFDGIKLADIM